MTDITTHPTELAPSRKASQSITRLLRRLSALAYAAAERLTSAQRDVPADFYRFPPF